MNRRRLRAAAVGTAALARLFVPVPGAAQLVRPDADWRTMETARFVIHHPVELEAWTRATASRLEAIHDAVTAKVGYEPGEPITVIVDDPTGASNGFAFPGPTILLWPTPPEPGSMLGEARGWGEILAVHELAHVAHLSRPSRNPRDRVLARLAPFPLQFLQFRAPRWATEGYATLVEGELTGSGRPFGVWRPAVLRTWALEGRLPAYGELSRTRGGFLQGSMAYLVGSAYLEWLVDRSDDAGLPDVWRRLTARRRRGFDEAFTGVFGAPPAELYGRFTAELTGRALAVEARLVEAGLASGELVQRLDGWSADPAISPDGRHLAILRRPDPEDPAEIVIWSTAPDTMSSEEREARERALALDPDDVAAVEWRPRPKRPVARLGPVGLVGYAAPRWMPGGEELLVVRPVGLGDGRIRPDLFRWRWRNGSVERVTHGAGIRSADPEAGGRTALAERCRGGTCDIVRVDLDSGRIAVVARGAIGRPLHRPRAGPDGGIVVSAREGARWRVAGLDSENGGLRWLDPDDGASRVEAEPAPDGSWVVVSDRSGVPDLERLEPKTREARPLTRVTAAAFAPAPAPDGSVSFLALTGHGYDLRRIAGNRSLDPLPPIEPALSPAARRPAAPVDTFPAAPPPHSNPYGIGPRARTIWPAGIVGPEGWTAGVAAHGTDPVGRLSWLAEGLAGSESAWRGAAATGVWRGSRPSLAAALFWSRQRPSAQAGIDPAGLDHALAGGSIAVELRSDRIDSSRAVEAGGSVARLDRPGGRNGIRTLGFAEARLSSVRAWRGWRIFSRSRIHGALGTTAGTAWKRGILSQGLAAGRSGPRLAVTAIHGWTDPGPGGFEAFVLGGVPPPLVAPAILSQRIAEPAVPVGYVTGDELSSLEIALEGTGWVPWYRWAWSGETDGRWRRAFGLEVSLDEEPLPFLGTPALAFVIGVARALDPPFEDETRVYAAAGYRP